MDLENYSFQMEAIILGISKITWLKEREDCIILMEIIIMENGKKIKLMDMDNTNHQVEEDMKAIGRVIRGTEKGNKAGQMGLNLKVTMN